MHDQPNFPPENCAHLDPDFPEWVNLITNLIAAGQKDGRFIILDGGMPAEEIIGMLRRTQPLCADLEESEGMGGNSLTIRYQPREVREQNRYVQLASNRFLLEVSLDEFGALRDAYLTLSYACAETGLDCTLKPLRKDRAEMLAILLNGKPPVIFEID
jgi:hypothetical protein